MDETLSAPESLPPDRMFADYQAPSGAFDETRHADGNLRPAWRRLLSSFDQAGHDDLGRRWEQTQRLIRENGIAYGAYLDAENEHRPWQLDALPLLISADEWQTMENGLRQRAELLEMILRDLYGPRRLLTEGPLPPEVVFAHPGFRRPYHGQQPLGDAYLRFYAADMARSPDGGWWILADRSEAPSGVGFALENRIVISRMFPAEFRDSRVRRLAPFFKTLRESLHKLARQRENPRIVLLSEGTSSANYFEDAYLARYLGFPLVEGADLTVRNLKVLLKTLGGLLPVDVIFRGLASAACDPLELDGHSQRGVAGLMQPARMGNIAVCNALGSGLVESPVFMAFMPRLCQFLLGEPLKLPGVATWWCGEPQSLSHVLANLDQLEIKPAFRDRADERRIAQQWRDLTREELADAIRAAPMRFVAQERVRRSTIPRWQGRDFQSAFLALRTYLVAHDGGYDVMPGGLARTSRQSAALEVSLLDGEGSKDAWVMSDQPVEHVSLLPPVGASMELRRGGADLPSRVADNLYWLGRYLERSDAYARLLRTVTVRLTGETDARHLPELPLLSRALANQGQIEPGFAVEGIRDQLPSIDRALPEAVLNREESGSLTSVFEGTFHIASKVRDRLSADGWRILLRLEEQFAELETATLDLTSLLNLSNELILELAAFGGTVMESMTRTQAFRFLEIGRRLERAVQLIQLMQSCFVEVKSAPSELLEAVLEVGDSLMTYRSRYMGHLQLSTVLDLLLTDETNPRSLAFQLSALADHVEQLPRSRTLAARTPDQKLVMGMLHAIRIVDIEAVSQFHTLGDQNPLHALLSAIARDLPLLSHAISHRYLVHAGPSQQLADIEPGPA